MKVSNRKYALNRLGAMALLFTSVTPLTVTIELLPWACGVVLRSTSLEVVGSNTAPVTPRPPLIAKLETVTEVA